MSPCKCTKDLARLEKVGISNEICIWLNGEDENMNFEEMARERKKHFSNYGFKL